MNMVIIWLLGVLCERWNFFPTTRRIVDMDEARKDRESGKMIGQKLGQIGRDFKSSVKTDTEKANQTRNHMTKLSTEQIEVKAPN